MSGEDGYHGRKGQMLAADDQSSAWVHAVLVVILVASVFVVRAPWTGFHAVLLGSLGILVALRPSSRTVPTSWLLLGGLFAIAACGVFLPASWFGIPEWRTQLEKLGVATGTRVAIQSQASLETLILFCLTLFTGLWMAGHRASPATLRRCALAFTIGVAASAVIARFMQDDGEGAARTFGFFPNRNHTANYLALGTICGLGCVLQAGRDKRYLALAFAIAATAVCVWAAFAWSISRGGILLIAIGTLAWLPLLGRRYLGRHGLWGIGLILIAAVGFFFLTESNVRERLGATVTKVSETIAPPAEPSADGAPSVSAASEFNDLDFRVPVFLDTVEMIGHYPLTGIGAGQFNYIFPQYKKRTIVAQHTDVYHPESDWLWMAAETGVPATLVLLALVILAFRRSLADVLNGRDRALRSACLVAAALVPLHGIFDVPGHRISLAFSAALLFSMSLSPSRTSSADRLPSPWTSYVMAFSLLVAAGVLASSYLPGGLRPAITAESDAFTEVNRLFQMDRALQQKAAKQQTEYQPDPFNDPLEKALNLIDETKPLAPINRDLLRQEGFIAFHFDDKFDRVDRAFAMDRALDPTWVEGVIRQGDAWVDVDPKKSAELFREALRRARIVERRDPQNTWNTARTLQRIRPMVAGKPELESLFAEER